MLKTMPSKSSTKKKKVSQSDLRRMMQQMKQQRAPESQPHGNNNIASIKRHQLPINTEIKRSKLEDISAVVVSQQKSAPYQQFPSSKGLVVNERKRKCNPCHAAVMQEAVPAKVVKATENKLLNISAGKGLLAAYSDSSSDEDNSPAVTLAAVPMSLATESSSSAHCANSSKPTSSSSLPEGFFDDPDVDATMRGVETQKTKMDREWETFQREVRHEADQSEQLIDEEQETGNLDRQIIEIDEQIQLYSLMDKLYDKKENSLNRSKQSHVRDVGGTVVDNEDTDEDSSSADDLPGWREKEAFT